MRLPPPPPPRSSDSGWNDVSRVSFISCALTRWKRLGTSRGTHRFVLFAGGYVIKLPVLWPWRLFLCGLLANLQEATFAATGWPELCPIKFKMPGGWFNVMQRADPLTDDEWSQFNYAQFIKGGKDLPDSDWIVPVEEKRDSFGKINGRIVAVDYGS